ncbi:Nucleotidyl transferase AbiEii toxin, Type IV TA system [Caldanaerovirga acetigignens]|uniref:Nucleotidyl transferase AbiEii toxin, Type IV TA system n=1 Tax=Caldanaerovirga acetigignens TaxID=447595 RepID=A0A1M7JR69_9FIRM|nr:nucleotidyl transferase AbiEii/AbiGii toxin family protein [Caldanaerovirga acetigignens]SHM55488.1 Nucleotidyl transferase AbiEii toxin, Type IV TA system [Caldanaerovirga acetigignens]
MPEHWINLFQKAIGILENSGIAENEWSFGGGSALSLYYNHRESFDVDIFLTDAQHLLLVTPRLNSYIEGIKDYTEMSNFVKLKMDEGEIDFILAPHLTEDWYVKKEILGRKIQVETPWEIVIKKLFYRPESLKVRDVVDTAVVLRNEWYKMLENSKILASKVEILDFRWEKIKSFYKKEAEKLIIHDTSILEEATELFDRYLQEIKTK